MLTAVHGVFVVPTVAGHANALLSHALLGERLVLRRVLGTSATSNVQGTGGLAARPPVGRTMAGRAAVRAADPRPREPLP